MTLTVAMYLRFITLSRKTLLIILLILSCSEYLDYSYNLAIYGLAIPFLFSKTSIFTSVRSSFWCSFTHILMLDKQLVGFAYYRILLVRLSTIYALFLYGILCYIYRFLRSLPIISYILADWVRISLVQVIFVYFYLLQTCVFHIALHSFLMGMEYIFYYLKKDTTYYRDIFNGLKFLRRSPFKIANAVGRIGSDGFTGGMGESPNGNWRKLVAWTAMGVSAIAATFAVNAYKSRNKAKVSMHDSNNRTKVSMYQSDVDSNTSKYDSDNRTKASIHESDNQAKNKRWW